MFNEQRLPTVKEEIFNGLSAQLNAKNSADEVGKWIAKLVTENPNIMLAVDAMGIANGLRVAALVYKLLDSQTEADQMNGDLL